MIVGDSSTAGLGLHRYAEVWPQVVAAARRRNVEVINAAVIGYSSEQAVRFLAGDGDRYDVDGLLVYLGNNDTAASSMSDAALLERIARSTRGIQAAHAWALDHSGLYVLVATAAQWSSALMQHRDFQSEAGAVVTREARVPLARFRDNLTTMIDWARRRGAEVYVVTPPLPLAYPPYVNEYVFRERYQPGWSGDACLGDDKALGAVIPAVVDVDHAAERWPQFDLIRTYDSDALGCLDAGADEQRRRFDALVEGRTPSAIAYDNLGYLEFRAGHYDRAAHLFATALAHQSGSNAYYDGVAAIAAYNAGVTAERLRDHAAAAAYLRQAIDLEEGKVRSSYVDAIRGLAARDVHVVEAQERFFAREAVGTETLFTDQVHPNRAGQKLVAKMVLRALPARVVAK
jgi:lysophospholipase L1-like esterase